MRHDCHDTIPVCSYVCLHVSGECQNSPEQVRWLNSVLSRNLKVYSNIIWSINEICKGRLVEQRFNISSRVSPYACIVDYKMSDLITLCIGFTTLNYCCTNYHIGNLQKQIIGPFLHNRVSVVSQTILQIILTFGHVCFLG